MQKHLFIFFFFKSLMSQLVTLTSRTVLLWFKVIHMGQRCHKTYSLHSFVVHFNNKTSTAVFFFFFTFQRMNLHHTSVLRFKWQKQTGKCHGLLSHCFWTTAMPFFLFFTCSYRGHFTADRLFILHSYCVIHILNCAAFRTLPELTGSAHSADSGKWKLSPSGCSQQAYKKPRLCICEPRSFLSVAVFLQSVCCVESCFWLNHERRLSQQGYSWHFVGNLGKRLLCPILKK